MSTDGGAEMKSAPFAIAWISETITEESAAHADVATSELGEDSPATLREALDTLNGGCWDSVDWRRDELIAYPADWNQDYRTGDYSAETLVIRSRRPEWLERLSACYAGEQA